MKNECACCGITTAQNNARWLLVVIIVAMSCLVAGFYLAGGEASPVVAPATSNQVKRSLERQSERRTSPVTENIF